MFNTSPKRFGAAFCGFVACSTVAVMAGTYDRYGVSDKDVTEYNALAGKIRVCAMARTADPDPVHPSDNPQDLLHVAGLYGQCSDELVKRHASAGALRTNDLFLGFTCSVLGSSTGVAVNAQACTSRTTPAPQ